ncbi:MAG: DUF4138 domain-containing protein [Sediminibacterium magnilacihabitans]|jgi:conjugative transposon TraN protein|nr:DUF4138 domain-containing protein [Sediminibacterium magnilacihabitans]PQV60411.1 conjugative transposon TraN protein [Sediminibacterium magnilacihabitans]
MKIIAVISLLMSGLVAAGQSTMPTRNLEVTANRTVSLIFPSSIHSVDRGSERIIVQKSTATVLRVKADSAFADTTNLTVITSDGKLYSFLVWYALSPKILTIDLGIHDNILKDTLLTAFALRAKQAGSSLHGIKYAAGNVVLHVPGIYTNGEQIALKLRISNQSSLGYEIGGVQAAVAGGRSSKRRAVQSRDVSILLTEMEVPVVRERQSGLLVIILPKTDLTRGQALQILVQEKGSSRQLLVSVPNKFLINATLLK